MTAPVQLATAALIALLQGTYAADPDPVVVLDGPPWVNPAEGGRPRAVFVGSVPDPAAPVAVGESEPDTVGRESWAETFTLGMVWSVDLASSSITDVRAAALDLWERGERAIREAPGGALGLNADTGPILGAWPAASWSVMQGLSKVSGSLTAAVVSAVTVRAQRG